MKTDNEFKNEVYARASKERARIKKRNRMIMTAVPCLVIALTAAATGVYYSASFSMKDAATIDAEKYLEREEYSEGVALKPPTEVQSSYQGSDEGYDSVTGAVSGSSAAQTENQGAAVQTKNSDKKGGSDRINYDFRAFADKTEEKVGEPQATVIASSKDLSEYFAAQEEQGELSEELKAELSGRDEEYFKNNTVVIITADCEYALADCTVDSNGTLTAALKRSESAQDTGCHMILTVYNKHFTNVVLRDA